MPITEFLEKNAQLYKDDISLVEINPELQEKSRVTWREYSLIEQGANGNGRCEITWGDFDKRANRFANLLLSRGIKKGDRVAILLMNCIEYLPIYFGILKTGALAVPLNYRYTADEIKYCLELSESEHIIHFDGFRIEAFKVNHNVPCYGYSIAIDRIGKFQVDRAVALGIEKKYWNRLQRGETIETENMTLGFDGRVFSAAYVENIVKKTKNTTIAAEEDYAGNLWEDRPT